MNRAATACTGWTDRCFGRAATFTTPAITPRPLNARRTRGGTGAAGVATDATSWRSRALSAAAFTPRLSSIRKGVVMAKWQSLGLGAATFLATHAGVVAKWEGW